ncbi:hypothetical protein B9Z55_005543 [Caenorhabditis nigoni]|uniref:Uncharacterized protein n=1 Tax=Caenorhabditis nigoni TaxID=1611254 RepID=A0A2G5V1E2_9PELO|nr:hypothetical protein B9Z55_005543 [Caenorhabditis nigoni]
MQIKEQVSGFIHVHGSSGEMEHSILFCATPNGDQNSRQYRKGLSARARVTNHSVPIRREAIFSHTISGGDQSKSYGRSLWCLLFEIGQDFSPGEKTGVYSLQHKQRSIQYRITETYLFSRPFFSPGGPTTMQVQDVT